MNIKSLLLGSAVAAVAATGARAADAIIIAEPEPMEYVRICDMYGAGFFYIPGTENCIKIGGYMRYEMKYNNVPWTNAPLTAGAYAGPDTDHAYRFWKFARFQLGVDVRSETELGTLRGYGEGRFDWQSYSWGTAAAPWAGPPAAANGASSYGLPGASTTYINQVYIELIQSMGTLRIGKTDTAWARFLGYSGGIDPFDTDYGFANSGEVSYTFNNGSGFTAIIAAVESGTGLFEPRVEAGANFSQGWGSIGGMVGYDTPANSWGVKGVANVNFAPVSARLSVFYASADNAYSAGTPTGSVGASRWSVAGLATIAVSDKLGVQLGAQWFDRAYSTAAGDSWQVMGGLNFTPVAGLQVMPSIRYTTRSESLLPAVASGARSNTSVWEANIRFQRSF